MGRESSRGCEIRGFGLSQQGGNGSSEQSLQKNELPFRGDAAVGKCGILLIVHSFVQFSVIVHWLFQHFHQKPAEKASQIIDDIVRRLKQDGGHLKNDLDGWTTWDNVIAMLEEYKSFLALGNQCTDKLDPNHVASLDFHMKMNLKKRGVTCVLHRLLKYHLGLFLDDSFGVKNKCGLHILDDMRRCVRTGITTCPSEHNLATSEIRSKHDVAKKWSRSCTI